MSTDTTTGALGPREPTTPTRLFSGSLVRTRIKRSTAFSDTLPAAIEEVAVPPKPAQAALYLALAHRWEAEIAAGIYRDRADIARIFGLTRARITQILDLTLLAPDIQAAVISSMCVGRQDSITVRRLLRVARITLWANQRSAVLEISNALELANSVR